MNIFEAILGNSLTEVKKNCLSGNCLEERDDEDSTPLMVAALTPVSQDIIKALFFYGADPNITDKDGKTALMLEAKYKTKKEIKLFLDAGANIEAKDKDGWTPLMYAARYNNLSVVKYLIECGSNIEVTDKWNWAPLMYAAQFSNLSLVKLLVERGADIKAKDNSGWTVLMSAAKSNNLPVVRYLVEHGADVNAEDNEGRTALVTAARNNKNTNTIKYLIKKKAKINFFTKTTASAYNSLPVVSFLLRNGAKISFEDNGEATPLMWAYLFNKRVTVVKYLIEQTENINEQETDLGATALIAACAKNTSKIVSVLIENGADVNLADKDGRTPLMYAVKKQDINAIKLLIQNGADVKKKDKDGETVFDYLERRKKSGKEEIKRLLLNLKLIK